CLCDPVRSAKKPTFYAGSVLPFPEGDDSGKGAFLKIFPHDIQPSTLAQSMTIEDCQFWRFGFGPWGAFKSRQVMMSPTADGDCGWTTVPSTSSDLHEWMVELAREQMKRAREVREKRRQEAMEKQEAAKQLARRVPVVLRCLLCLNPESEEEEEEGDWDGDWDWDKEEREWEKFLEEERQYH
ncbi:hypothetical protein V5O48_019615, partial [Marasmius crinis-equi]